MAVGRAPSVLAYLAGRLVAFASFPHYLFEGLHHLNV
jgi:hypothetical protein